MLSRTTVISLVLVSVLGIGADDIVTVVPCQDIVTFYTVTNR